MEKVLNGIVRVSRRFNRTSVLVITERFYPESFLINDLVQEWDAAGFDVRVLTQVPSYPIDRVFSGYINQTSRSHEAGVHVTRIKTVTGYSRSLIRKIMSYLNFLARGTYQVLRYHRTITHLFVYHTGPLTQAFPAALLKILKPHVRTTIWTQDVWPDTVFAYGLSPYGAPAVILKFFVRLVYRFFDAVIVSSPGFSARLQPYLPALKKPVFIPQWVPDAFANAGGVTDLVFDQGKTKFIYTGNIGTMQNLFNVVAAFRSVVDDAHLYILGDGSKRAELSDYIAGNGVQNVHMLGPVPQSEVQSCIRQCDFAVLSLTPSDLINLTIPAKFQAYLSAGRPILCVANGEVRGLVENQDLGITANPDNVGDISAKIGDAMHADIRTRQKWMENMRKLLTSAYSKESSVKGITDIVYASVERQQ